MNYLITSHFFIFFRRTLLLPFLQIGLISCVNLVVKKEIPAIKLKMPFKKILYSLPVFFCHTWAMGCIRED